jgi:hypothetical protein
MAETDTITRNAVQELLELPVARKPLAVEIELPTGYKVKVQALTDKLEALSDHEQKRLYQGTWEHTQREPPPKSLLSPEYQIKIQQLIDYLAGIPRAEWEKQVREHRRAQLENVSPERLRYFYGQHNRFSATCMPSRNRLLGL